MEYIFEKVRGGGGRSRFVPVVGVWGPSWKSRWMDSSIIKVN